MRTNYGHQIYKDYERAVVRIEELERENREIPELRRVIAKLNAEIERLNAKIADFDRVLEETVARAVKAATEPLYAEISRLKAIINKDSTNSGKPPSSNGFKKIPNSREKSGLSVGGQNGHAGHTLKVPDNLDELANEGKIVLRVDDRTGGASDYVRTYTLGIEVKPVWTEHRWPRGSLEIPTYVQYDSSVKGLCVLLTQAEFVSAERTAELLDLLTDGQVSPSQASVCNFVSEAAERIDERYRELKEEVRNAEILCTDETPVRSTERLEYDENGENPHLETAHGKTFNVFIRVYSTLKTALFTANAHKGDVGVRLDGVLSLFFRGRLPRSRLQAV